MSVEQRFRWLMIVANAPFVAFIHLQLLRGAPTRARFYHANEPLLLAAAVRSCVVPCIGGVVLYMIDPAWMAWSSLPLPAAVRLCGVPFMLLSELMFAWSMLALGNNFSVSLAIFPHHQLIESGPYRWLRHPMYASLLLLCPALLLVTANWFIAGALAAAWPLVLLWRTPLEELALWGRFGASYLEYANQRPRFWPRVRAHHSRLEQP